MTSAKNPTRLGTLTNLHAFLIFSQMKIIYKTIPKVLFIITIIFYPLILFGYIGPGAGFAFFGSFTALLIAFFLLIFSILSLPIRILISILKRVKTEYTPLTKKAIVIGMDGLDPAILRKFIKDGKLPNFKKLIETGDFKNLKTTTPALSPVAWSTFQTGTNPAKHNIYDFLKRKSNSYRLENSDSSIFNEKRKIRIGKYIFPLGKPYIRLNRMGKSFWEILSEYGIFSKIIKVPITFPPIKFNGLTLSGLGVPDLLGAQGEFIYYTDDKKENISKTIGGKVTSVRRKNHLINSYIPGPPSPFKINNETLKIPFKIDLRDNKSLLKIQGKKFELKEGEYTDWVELKFKAFPGISINGITKFLLKGKEPFRLYLIPINISPKNPAMPISYPSFYSRYLYYILGNFSTLGFAEDTWALMDNIITDKEFIQQCYSNHLERERLFFHSLSLFNKGVLAVVFDLSDRIHHMFLKDEEKIENLYKTMDNLLGRVLKFTNHNTLLLVLSDHGFKEFKWEFNVNAWLIDSGYMKIKSDIEEKDEYFEGVDWNKTKAYSYGYTNIYLNIKNREPEGIVDKKEIIQITNDIKNKLKSIKNPTNNEYVFKEVYLKDEIYDGPYFDNAPDIILGYNVGYRTSWDSVIGKINSSKILTKNREKWVGDHSFNPDDVPGIIISNWKIKKESPGIEDIASTILDAFGIKIPNFIDGESLLKRESK